MRDSARSALRRGLGLAAVLASALILLEVSARVYLFGLAGLSPAMVNSLRGLPATGFTRPSAEPRLVFELAPNVDGLFKLVAFRTNSHGLRDREYPVRKPEGTFRVAVVGSSFSLPAGVAIERAYHSLLEERWSREFAPLRCEFLNFAVGMYHPEQVLAMLELRALAYEPDLVLVTATMLSMPWLVNDPASEAGRKVRALDPGALPRFRKSYPFLRSFLWRLMQQRTGRLDVGEDLGLLERGFMAVVERLGPAARRAEGWPARADGAAFAYRPRGSVIERLARVRERSGVPLALVRLEFEDGPATALDLEVEEAARSHGVPYFDSRRAFRGTRGRDFWIHPLDPHPNWRAHEVFARAIDTFLRSNGLSPGVPRP